MTFSNIIINNHIFSKITDDVQQHHATVSPVRNKPSHLPPYCSASEVRHPSEVHHLHLMTTLKTFYCPVMEYMYTLPLKEAIPFI